MIFAFTFPALLRWPLVLAPLYALAVVVFFAMLFWERRHAGRETREETPQRDRQGLRVIRGGH